MMNAWKVRNDFFAGMDSYTGNTYQLRQFCRNGWEMFTNGSKVGEAVLEGGCFETDSAEWDNRVWEGFERAMGLL